MSDTTDQLPKGTDTAQKSIGEQRVRTSFNAAGDTATYGLVDSIKQKSAGYVKGGDNDV